VIVPAQFELWDSTPMEATVGARGETFVPHRQRVERRSLMALRKSNPVALQSCPI